MKGHTKSNVDYHRVGYGGHAFPAVNVKVNRFPTAQDIMVQFGCSEKAAERAGELAIEASCEHFWRDIQETATHYLPDGKVYSAGSSDGWLIVEGLPEVSDWDGVQLNAWACFEKAVRREVEYLCSSEYVFDSIKANRWAHEQAERYNFFETADKRDLCMVDIKVAALAHVKDQFGIDYRTVQFA